ncbi:MAG TPA: hypothetical protein VGK73_00355 [Polyangiaceae bacterium]
MVLRERPLVQTVAVIAVALCVLFSVVPVFLRNLRASRMAEPMDHLAFIASRASLLAAGRPVEAAYPPSAPLTPSSVPKGELVLDPPGTWDHPTWRLLDFRLDTPHAFSFAFESENAPEGSRFRATARGDLDGDGNLSTFVIAGECPKAGTPSTGALAMHREVE